MDELHLQQIKAAEYYVLNNATGYCTIRHLTRTNIKWLQRLNLNIGGRDDSETI